MARRKDREKAIKLREKGMSYSQIKKELDIPKSTLSNWLSDYPLSRERIRELRDNSPQRIEKYINTRRKTREAEFARYYKDAREKIGDLAERDIFISGLFLYWAEGGKTTRYTVTLSNTNPAILKFYIEWLIQLGADQKKIKVKLQLYSDMDVKMQKEYWRNQLDIPLSQFNKSYIKSTRQSDLTYKRKYRQGTCDVRYHNKEIAYFVHMALKNLNELYE